MAALSLTVRGGTLKRARPIAAGLDFSAVYDAWLQPVTAWIRAFGGLEVDYEDVAQEVFLVVRRKLSRFDGENLAGWLYRITQLTVRDYRRRAWFRRLVFGRDQGELERVADPRAGTALIEHKDEMRRLARALDRMDERRRAAFILFEIEGLSGEAIAALEGIPIPTVWTRLHYARKELFALLAADEDEGSPGKRGR